MARQSKVQPHQAAGGRWDQPGVPHKGWTCSAMEDLGEPTHLCEMCQRALVRYVHYMDHPDYAERLGVGCICAGHMEENYALAEARERDLVNQSQRRRTWLTRNWRESAKGNEFLNVPGYNVVIFARGSGWTYRIGERDTYEETEPRFGPTAYRTKDAAKLAAFDALEQLRREAGV